MARITTSAGYTFPEFVRTQRSAGRLPEACHRIVERELDTVLLQVALDEARALRIERRHDLAEHLDDCHAETTVDQVLRHLEANEPASDHDRALWLVQRLESRGRVLLGQIT